jgi:hypothetical protein
LIKWNNRRFQILRDRQDYIFFIAGLLVFAAVLAPFATSTSRYGPVVTRREAIALPEFHRHGRSEFFVNGFEFWSNAPRSGLLSNGMPQHIAALALLAVVLWLFRVRDVSLAPLAQIALAATTMWAAAHLLLFKLHLPARYSQWVFQILYVMAAAIALIAIFEFAERWREQLRQKQHIAGARAIAIALLLGATALLVYPHLKSRFPNESYVQERPRALYQFLRTQPKTAVIAALKKPSNLIPVFAQRSVLVNSEYAIPYHQGYYRLIRQRGEELVRAFYTSRPDELFAFIQKYHVDLFVIGHGDATRPQFIKKLRWFRDVAPLREISERVEQGERPVLADFVERATIWEDKTNIVLDAHLIAQIIHTHETSP